jgi:hypothetical protein
VKGLKCTIGGIGTVAFLIAGIVVLRTAEKYQLSGTRMPNGKGGYMAIWEGYQLAITFIAMGCGWAFFTWKMWRNRKPDSI